MENRPYVTSDKGLKIIAGIDLDKKDFDIWIEKIVTEVAEISILKDVFEKSKKLLLSFEDSNLLIETLNKNFIFSFVTRLGRIIEPYKNNYDTDDYSLLVLLEKYNKTNNNVDEKDIEKLKTVHSKIKKFRDKEIAHLTIKREAIKWSDLEDCLNITQKMTNKYLKIIKNEEVEDWKISLNHHTMSGSSAGNAKYYDGAWIFFWD